MIIIIANKPWSLIDEIISLHRVNLFSSEDNDDDQK